MNRIFIFANSVTRTASIIASSQLGVNHPSYLISSCLARASSCNNGLIPTLPPPTAVADQFIVLRGIEERDSGPRERMVTGERGQRAAAMMVGGVDRRETADAVERFCLELRDAAWSHLRQGEDVRGP
jgi:hypothetical protein